MKRILEGGRLFDDTFCFEVQSRTFERRDPVTGEDRQYRERLYREYVLKPGHTIADTWVQGTYGRHIVEDHCDLGKGDFFLMVSQGWNEGVVHRIGDVEAKRWFLATHPEDVDGFAKVFGQPANAWREDGKAALVEAAEAKVNSMRWDKERAEERLKVTEAEVERLKAKLESLTKAPGAAGSAGGEA